MIQILWRCNECGDYGTIDLTPEMLLLPNLISGKVDHLDLYNHRMVISDIYTDWRALETSKNENSGVQS